MHYTVSVERSDEIKPRHWVAFKPDDLNPHQCQNITEVMVDAFAQIHDLEIDGLYDPQTFGDFVEKVFKGAERDHRDYGPMNMVEFEALGMDCKSFNVSPTIKISVAVWIRK